jgi:hypothetical protein
MRLMGMMGMIMSRKNRMKMILRRLSLNSSKQYKFD